MVKLALGVSCLLAIVIKTHCFFADPYPQYYPEAEYYRFSGRKKIGIFHDPVYFFDAEVLCKSKNGQLLEINNQIVGSFIARALYRSRVGQTTLWVGATYLPSNGTHPGMWLWLTQVPVPNKTEKGDSYPLNKPPYWAVKPDVNIATGLCMAVERKNLSEPITFALPCTVKRPYICDLPNDEAYKTTEIYPVFLSSGKAFHLFKSYSTWQEAYIYCVERGYHLASIQTPLDTKRLKNRLERTRPHIPTIWLGGKLVKQEWKWFSEVTSISDSMNITNSASNWVELFPYLPTCLMINSRLSTSRYSTPRLSTSQIIYRKAHCKERISFLCEEDISGRNGLIRVPNSDIWFSNTPMSWQEANDYCLRCLGGNLMSLEAYDPKDLPKHMHSWYKAMTEATKIDIRSIWLNGYRALNGKFVWARSRGSFDEPVQQEMKEIVQTIEPAHWTYDSVGNNYNGGAYIIFCAGNVTEDLGLNYYSCLNMDRDNHSHYSMYGLDCDIKQHFFCMEYDNGEYTIKLRAKVSKHLKDDCKNDELPWPKQ